MRNGFFVYTHGQIINKRVNGMITSATQMEWNDLPKEKKKKRKKNNYRPRFAQHAQAVAKKKNACKNERIKRTFAIYIRKFLNFFKFMKNRYRYRYIFDSITQSFQTSFGYR